MAVRIYVVKQTIPDDKFIEILVRAANVAQAINAVSKPQFSAEVASQDDLLRLAPTHKPIDAGE